MNKLKIASPNTTKRLTKNLQNSPFKTKSNKNKLSSISQTTSEQITDTVTKKSFQTSNNSSSLVSSKQLLQEINSESNLLNDSNESVDCEMVNATELSSNSASTSIANVDHLTDSLNNDPNCAELLLKVYEFKTN